MTLHWVRIDGDVNMATVRQALANIGLEVKDASLGNLRAHAPRQPIDYEAVPAPATAPVRLRPFWEDLAEEVL